MTQKQEIALLKKEVAEMKKIVKKLWHIKEVDDTVLKFTSLMRESIIDISVLTKI